jgi:hypothetical protein
LSLMDGSVSIKDQQAVFTGKARTESSITTGLVTAVVRKKSSGKMVATGSLHLDIVGSTTPGQILDYRLVIPLPTNVNPASVETEVTSLGQQ